MIVGIIGGLFIGFLLALILVLIMLEINATVGSYVAIGLLISCIILGGLLGKSIHNAVVETFITQYQVIQQTYTYSLDDERLSGLERVEVTQSIMEANEKLASYKVSVNKWWNIDIRPDLRDQVLKLDYIR